MNAGLALLFLVLFAVVLIFGPIIYALVGDRNKGLSKKQKRELQELRTLFGKIDQLAYQNRDVNPELATQILYELQLHKAKELE